MTKRLHLITLLIAVCFQYALAANTYDFESEHIYYQVTSDSTVAVSGVDDTYTCPYDPSVCDYSDIYDVYVPSLVYYNGTDYIVTSIADSAFYGMYCIDAVTIPETVTFIGKAALKGHTVKCLALNPPAVVDTFDGDMLLVHEEAYERYKSARGYIGHYILSFDGTPATIPSGYVFTYGDDRGCVVLFENCGENTSIYEQHGYGMHDRWYWWESGGWLSDPSKPIIIECSYNAIPHYYRIDAFAVVDNHFYIDLIHVADLGLYNNYSWWDFFYGGVAYCFGYDFYSSGPYDSSVSVTFGEYPTKYSGDFVIPSIAHFAIWDYEVNGICNDAFNGCVDLSSVTLPATIQMIGSSFTNCPNLIEINCLGTTPPDQRPGCPEEANMGFSEDNFKNIILKVPFSALDAYRNAPVWRNFQNIVGVDFSPVIEFADQNVKALCVQNWDINGDGELSQDEAAAVTSLNSVFKGNSSITSFNELAYFTGLTSIQINEFMNCTKLTSVVLPNSVTSIGEGAFTNCTALKSVFIPNSVTTIGGAAFFNCSKLASVTIPISVTDIGGSAFQNCLALRTLNFNAVSCADFSSMSSPFYDLNISTINFGDSVQRISAHFVCGLENMKSLTIPNSVTSIGDYAFDGCFGLTNITFGESLEIIGNSAFYGCEGLTSLVLPQSLASVQEKAFEDCSNISSVKCLGTIPASANQNSFDEMTYQNASLCVPNDAVEAYRQAEGWKKFLNIGGVYDFEQDGLYYKITNTGEVSLTTGPQPYSGSVMVPTEVTFDGVTYTVTGIANGTFANAELSNLYLPVTIGNIGDGAFVGCNIQSLYITGVCSWQDKRSQSFTTIEC